MKKIILLIIVILLLCADVGFYLYEVFVNHVPPTENLLRTLAIFFAGLSTIFKLYKPKKRHSLQFYELRYDDIIGNAFAEQPKHRKKLLKAIRIYNQNKFLKAIKQLEHLKKYCQKVKDHYVVHLFIALCYTDAQLVAQAIAVYQHMISKNFSDTIVYSNLGHIQLSIGKYEDAIRNFEYALSMDRNNAQAYNNLASAYFDMDDLDSAVIYAQKALAINGKMHQAATLLTIIYAIKNDRENFDKYFHIAVSSGQNAKELNDVVAYYLNSKEYAQELV